LLPELQLLTRNSPLQLRQPCNTTHMEYRIGTAEVNCYKGWEVYLGIR